MHVARKESLVTCVPPGSQGRQTNKDPGGRPYQCSLPTHHLDSGHKCWIKPKWKACSNHVLFLCHQGNDNSITPCVPSQSPNDPEVLTSPFASLTEIRTEKAIDSDPQAYSFPVKGSAFLHPRLMQC